MLLKNAMAYNEDFDLVRADIAVEGERIVGIGLPQGTGETLDLTGCTILPGFIDMHIHGCAGHDASEATPEALEAMSALLVKRASLRSARPP